MNGANASADAATARRAGDLAEAVLPRIRTLAADVEFASYLVACRLDSRDGWGEPDPDVEEFRAEVRRALRSRLAELWPDRRVVASGADVSVVVRPDRPGLVSMRPASLFVAGRYQKLVRAISQTVFHCRRCRGRPGGCPACGHTRRLVAEAVEDSVRPPIERAANGTASSFHGSGREDVDVRMLGAGRPFVVKVSSPRRRTVDAQAVSRDVEAASGGRVTVSELRIVDRATMGRLTTSHGTKTYRAVLAPCDGRDFPSDAATRLERLRDAAIRQRTPERVESRRADLVRLRRVLTLEVEEVGCRSLTVMLRTDPGTYVKELISGDHGRTEPSFAAALGQACECVALDVLATGD